MSAPEQGGLPDGYRDKNGTVWMNLRKRPNGFPGVFDPTWDAEPLFFITAHAADAELRAAVEGLVDEWGDEDEGIAHVAACQDYGCKDCVVIACTTDLRSLLAGRGDV